MSDLIRTENFVLFDIWATWCAPCVAELPELKRFKENIGKDNVLIVGLSCNSEQEQEEWLSHIRKHELDWLNFRLNTNLVDFLGSYALPFYILTKSDLSIVVSGSLDVIEDFFLKNAVLLK